MTLEIYEYTPKEIDELLPFRNASFGHLSREQWEAMDCTGVVAREDGRLVGFIPLQYREQCLNARVSIPVVYENAVGVAEGKRGQGIGTQMIEETARFMSDRVDALMVVRGGERSGGYRFYRKTGHGDLMYARWYSLPQEGLSVETARPLAPTTEISVLDRERWLALEPRLLALYQARYGQYGGGRRRTAGYWATFLDGHIYAKQPRWLVTLTSNAGDGHTDGHLAGYLVAVQGIWSSAEDVYVYEVVGEDDHAVEWLIRYACGFPNNGRLGVPLVSLANPFRAVLRRMGFAEGESTPHVMARILRPDRIFCRLAAGSDLLRTLSLTVVTPHRTLAVNDPPQPRYTVQFETKENTLSRLFCCRLDLEAALDMELIRWNGDDPGLRRELSQVYEYAEWVQWFTDFV